MTVLKNINCYINIQEKSSVEDLKLEFLKDQDTCKSKWINSMKMLNV